jgi:hypothetical protein
LICVNVSRADGLFATKCSRWLWIRRMHEKATPAQLGYAGGAFSISFSE